VLSVAPTGRKLILKATIAALATTAALASASIGVARLSAPVVSSAPIPANLALREIFVDGSSLELAGTMTLAGQAGIACVRASLAAAPLELTKIVEPNCDDPGLIGEPVAPFVTAPTPGYSAARVAYDSNGRVDLGPVLASYPDDSGSHLEWAYGPGALWLYEDETASGPTVFRISEGTGRLVRATPVPGLVRPLLAADSAGLYLAGTGSYGGIGKDIIWHVGAEASKAQVVVTAGAGDSVSWITAQGEDVWADICRRPSGSACEISRFHGPNLVPVFRVSDRGRTGRWIVGNTTDGFYSSVVAQNLRPLIPSKVRWELIRIDPSTGAITDVTTLMLPAFWDGPNATEGADAVVYDGSLYVVSDPQGTSAGVLYRVQP